MKWYLAVLKNDARFSGHAHRTEYWMFTLFNTLITFISPLILGIIVRLLLPHHTTEATVLTYDDYALISVGIMYCLAVTIPALAVGARRLHDTGTSGWMLLIGLIPIIGGIWLLLLMCEDSQPGDNQYGPNPKGIAVEKIPDSSI